MLEGSITFGVCAWHSVWRGMPEFRHIIVYRSALVGM